MIAHVRPSPLWRAGTLAGLAAVLAFAAWTDGGALADPRPEEPGLPAPPDDLELQAETVSRAREIGVAMTLWQTDLMFQAGSGDVTAEVTAAAGDPAAEPTADWSACPRISYEELSKVLVGAYLDELPRTDAWGHPFEYCLDLEHPAAPRYVVGVRSPGRDGRWQGDVYDAGGFPPGELDRDLLWIDGYFVTWPDPR